MLKAVKECMKNWLVTHERLYWYIVVGLAVLGFGIVTAMGMAKLERAEAAEEISNPCNLQIEASVAENISSVLPFEEYFSYAICVEDISVHFKRYYLFDILPTFNAAGGNLRTSSDYSGKILILVVDTDNVIINADCRTGSNSNYEFETDYDRFIGSSFDIGVSGYEGNNFRFGALQEYSPDAPYVIFKSLIIDNLLTKGFDDKNVAGHLYTDYFVPSYWQIFYNLENISELDISYKLNLQFEVEIPTLSYVQDLYENFGYDFSSERSILKRSKELVEYWNKHKNADSRTVTVDYSLDIVPNTYGNFNYQFSFLEWEYMLRASSSELNAEFDSYSVKERSALLAFMHVKKITSEVVTTRADSVVYGGYTTNVFERGVYDSCVDVYTKVDKNFVSSDVLDDLISSDLDAAEDAYKEELENRLDEMQNQIDSMNNFEAAFGGNLEGTDLWTGFGSLSKGVSSLGPSISNISALTGQVFGFLPGPISSIMYFTLFAVCIIAIIKAIRG